MDPMIIVVLGIGSLMIFGAGIALLSGAAASGVDKRLEEFVGPAGTLSIEEAQSIQGQQGRAGLGDRMDDALEGRGFADKIRTRISKADVKLRVSEYIALQLLSAVGGGFLAYQFFSQSTLLAILGVLVGLRVPRIYMGVMASRRLVAFDNQLSDTLNLWVNSLRSGYSVLQGMEAIAAELPPPVGTEFERVVQEVRLGLSLSQALDNMLRRVPSEDLDLVVTAVNIQREVGGNLTEVLDRISHTIRERVRIKGEIRTLTAQGRISGWAVGMLPIALTLILYRINPSYIGELWAMEKPFIIEGVFPCGYIALGLGGLMILFGIIAIRKIVNIEV
jgi:tight adherence protein B